MVRTKKSKSTKKPRSVDQKTIDRYIIRSNLVEKKRHRGAVQQSPSSTVSVTPMIVTNAQGLGDLNVRIGDTIQITKFEMIYTSLLADTTNYLRMVIFWWCDNNNTAPAEADIFDDNTSNAFILYGPLHEDNIKGGRLKVLYDKHFSLSSSRSYLGGRLVKTFKRPHEITFTGASTTIGRGIPYIALVSDSGTVSHPTWNSYHAFHYVDL